MSITFTFAASDGNTDIIGIPCPLCATLSAAINWTDYESPEMDAYFAHRNECPTKEWDVNMSNDNAERVMGVIGIPFDYSGIIDPAKLMELVETNCTWPETMEGYVASRVLQLYALAKQAMDRKIQVGWS